MNRPLLWYSIDMMLPELYLPTKPDSSEEEYVTVTMTWWEVLLLSKTLHHYFLVAPSGFPKLAPDVEKHAYILQPRFARYCSETLETDFLGYRLFAPIPVFLTLHSYRTVTGLLCLYEDSAYSAWEAKTRQGLERKLEALKFAIAVVNAGA